ncbi:MAG: heme-binding domain-containing protein [Acidobacteriota bacterium]|nr:heme-binding domain-containing protein [Acidobacteriota bacterium]
MNKWRVLRWLVVICACLFVLAQFSRPARTNPVVDQSLALESRIEVSPPVSAIIDRSCSDCHSNKTRWPWYSNVAPVSWFVIGHVNEGRQNLNFSEWGRYTKRETDGLLKQICQEVKAEAMPLSSYTPLHPGSTLSDEDKKILCDWASAASQRPNAQ